MSDEIALQPTPAEQFQQWAQPFPFTTSYGRTVLMRHGLLTEELLYGTLPNEFIQKVVFDQLDVKQELWQNMREQYKMYGMACARLLLSPVLILEGEPRPGKNEITLGMLHYNEVFQIYRKGMEVVPPLASAPFSSLSNDARDAGTDTPSGDDVPTDAEPVPALAE